MVYLLVFLQMVVVVVLQAALPRMAITQAVQLQPQVAPFLVGVVVVLDLLPMMLRVVPEISREEEEEELEEITGQ